MRLLFIAFFIVFFLVSLSFPAFAVTNPLSVPNNKVGIHILFPEELADAAKLVNSSGGDWGYVTIPIQAGDRDMVKWQKFMDDCKRLHVIPLVRLATEGDYFNTKVWRKPQDNDIVDFANFLNSLEWPTKNQYIIVFNEVNRSDEWGGLANPKEYAEILSYTVSVFKSKNQDFFIIASGFDNASINIPEQSFNEYTFIELMQQAVPGIFNQIDGIASHSYPNPAFAKPPTILDIISIASFHHEQQFIRTLRINQSLPIFITETGWSQAVVAPEKIATYFQQAFTSPWNDEDVIAVTPFLLRADAGAFGIFSFITSDGQPSASYNAIIAMKKVNGAPMLTKKVLGEKTEEKEIAEKTFPQVKQATLQPQSFDSVKHVLKWIFKL